MANRALVFVLLAFIVAAVAAEESQLNGLDYVRRTLLKVSVPASDATIIETDDELKGCSQCPSGNTCCNLGGGWVGCCPITNAVCCPQTLSCCPPGYYCAGDYCRRNGF